MIIININIINWVYKLIISKKIIHNNHQLILLTPKFKLFSVVFNNEVYIDIDKKSKS